MSMFFSLTDLVPDKWVWLADELLWHACIRISHQHASTWMCFLDTTIKSLTSSVARYHPLAHQHSKQLFST